MLPVTSTNIFGSNNKLFDFGAQLSLIRQEETADSLGLKGKEISTIITKVGGQEEINTKAQKIDNQWMIPYPWKKRPKIVFRNQALKQLESIELCRTSRSVPQTDG